MAKPTLKAAMKTVSKKRIPFEKLAAWMEKNLFSEKAVNKLGYTWEEGRGGNYHLVKK